AVPWAADVEAPGAAHPERQQFVYGPFPAQLLSLQAQGRVPRGALLASFKAPDLDAQRQRSEASVRALEQRLAGLMADATGVGQQQAIIRRLNEQRAEIHAVRAE